MIHGRTAKAFLCIRPNAFAPESFPVEIGLCLPNEGMRFLVRPAEHWPAPDTPDVAQLPGGISWNESLKGDPCPAIADTLNKVLASLRVYSGNPEWDRYWLDRLHRAAGVSRSYLLADLADLMSSSLPKGERAIAIAAAQSTAADGTNVGVLEQARQLCDVCERALQRAA